jgi:glutamate/tyrosine decarboxylase-like PLP-dependent enzyme
VAALPSQLRIYASSEVHSCHAKAVELLGLGRQALVIIPVDQEYRIDIGALRTAIAADRAAGRSPCAVVGNAGTINTGAIDDLSALAALCAEERLWFHVDGAIGAVATLAPTVRPLLIGIERADSVALDLHKWLHVPFEAGCALVRDRAAHRATFAVTPDYLAHALRGLASGSDWFSEYGLQLSRGFRALKVWLSFKEHGLDKYGRLIEQNIAQTRELIELIRAEPELELMAAGPLNIVCYRYVAPGLSDEALSALNEELLVRLHEGGRVAPSYTRLRGRYCLRVAIANHRTVRADLPILVQETLRHGRQLADAAAPRR